MKTQIGWIEKLELNGLYLVSYPGLQDMTYKTIEEAEAELSKRNRLVGKNY